MPTTSIAPFIKQRYFDANGNPLAGGKLYTYQSGTSTPQATYTDATGGTANANPVVLDADGEADVWLDVSLSYKFVLKDSSANIQWTVDGIIGLLTNNSVTTAALQDLSVTTAKLAGNAVTSAKLASDASIDGNRAVTTNHIRDANITAAKLAAGASGKWNMNAQLSANNAAIGDFLLLDTTGGTFATALPAPSASNKGVPIKAKWITGTAQPTITGTGPELPFTIQDQNDVYEFTNDATNWYIS